MCSTAHTAAFVREPHTGRCLTSSSLEVPAVLSSRISRPFASIIAASSSPVDGEAIVLLAGGTWCATSCTVFLLSASGERTSWGTVIEPWYTEAQWLTSCRHLIGCCEVRPIAAQTRCNFPTSDRSAFRSTFGLLGTRDLYSTPSLPISR